METVRLKLTQDTVTPPSQRWDETTDEVQISPDGGATWYPDPALDPRTSSVYRQPARTGTDPKCDAAADMVATLQALINTAIDAIGTAQAANAILAIITVFTPGIGWLVRLILAIVEAVLAIGSSVIDAAFTQAVYDDLLCIFYENIDADGQMSDAQLSDIYDAIAATQDTTVQAVFGHFSTLIGAVGWSNAGATGESVGDCTACIEECPGCADCDGTIWTTSTFSSFTGDGQQVGPFRVDAPTGIGGGQMFPAALGDVGWVMDSPTCVARFQISANVAGAGRWKIQIGDITSIDFGGGITTIILATPQCVTEMNAFLHSGTPGQVSFNNANFSWCE